MLVICRRNLDPESKRTDQELWEALEIAQLKEVVSELDNGLGNQPLYYQAFIGPMLHSLKIDYIYWIERV